MTNARHDERLIQIREEFGLRGLARWWILLEIIGQQMNESDKCEATFRPGTWTRELGFRSSNDCRTFLERLANVPGNVPGMISVRLANDWTVRCDKLLKIRARKKPIGGKLVQTDIRSKNKNKSKKEKETSYGGKEKELFGAANGLTLLAKSWNRLCPSLPQVLKISQDRKRKEALRLKNIGRETLEKAMVKLEVSDFCRGENDRQWKATYDWLIAADSNALKAIEGKYDRTETKWRLDD